MNFLRSLADKYWWAAIPLSALSILSLCLERLEAFGLDTRQWLDIVHAIVIRWNFWLDQAFQFLEWLIPFDISVTPFEQNVLVIIFLLVLPGYLIVVKQSLKDCKYKLNNYFSAYLLTYVLHAISFILLSCMIIFFLTRYADDFTDPGNGLWLAFILSLGLFCTYYFRRKFFYGLVFVAALLLSIEFLRFVPTIQPQVDAFQEWLESVPTTPEADNGAPTP